MIMRRFVLKNSQGCIFDSVEEDSLEDAIEYFRGEYTGTYYITEYDEIGRAFEDEKIKL